MSKSYAEAKVLRLTMRYSIGVMAQLVGVKKATYQGYDNGRRPTPPEIIDKMKQHQQWLAEFMAGIAVRVDEQLRAEGFAGGIPSEIEQEEMEL